MRLKYLALLGFCLGAARADFEAAAEAAKKFELPSGIKIEAVAAEPHLANPVAFSMDRHGRIYVAETYRLDNAVVDITRNPQWIKDDLSLRYVADRAKFLTNAFGTNATALTKRSERLNVLFDDDGDGIIDTNRPIRQSFGKVESGLAAGVLAFGDRVWFACIPDLWSYDFSLNRTNPIVRQIATGFGVHIGVTGHDMHGLAMGMDGKLYFSIGDRGFTVRARRGVLNYPDTGAVLRCNPDGSDIEVVAIGLRNPQELAFDELGNLWTADNDTAGEDKSRLIHVVEGADYGWRASYQHMKGFGPWVREKLWEGRLDGTLPTCGEPAQGPSGLAYYPGTGLPAEFNGRFLLCDFPGGIQSFAVEPKGASYAIKDKKRFLWNAWPTDVEFGSDGFLYFSDWVSGWTLPGQGRIYRLTQADGAADPKIAETAKVLREGFEARDGAALVALLDHHDLRIRQGAHLALARKRAESAAALRDLAGDSTKPRAARLHAIWAMRLQGAIEAAVVEKLLADSDPEVRAQAVASAPFAGIVKMFKDENPRVRFFAAEALLPKLLFDSNNSLAVSAIIEMLEANNDKDPYLTHAGVRLLGFSSPALLRAKRHASVSVRRAALLAERTVGSPSIANYLKDRDLAYEAARAINDIPIGAAYPQLAAMLTNDCPENILSRAINANFRTGGAESARRLAAFAASTNAPVVARVDALECLASWQDPDELDRVVGLWRPVAPNVNTRPDALALEALDPHWSALLRDSSDAVAMAALHCARALLAQNQTTNVAAALRETARSREVRAAALEVLRDLDDSNFPGALESALADPTLQADALKFVPTNATPAMISRIVEIASGSGGLETSQAALAALGRAAPAEGLEPLRTHLGKLRQKDLRAELALDVLQAAKSYPALQADADEAARAAFTQPEYEPLFAGGNAKDGRRIFEERSDLACLRCHALNGNGGTVGPALDGIGARQSRAHLLESILFPNSAIAPGFESVAITLKNGRQIAGVLISETGVQLEINSFEDGRVTVKKNEIRAATRSASAMPESLGEALTPFELRNLVEFLASLK